MNILFLAPRLPVPADTGGQIRTLNILRQMSRFADIHLASFSFDPEDALHVDGLYPGIVGHTLVPLAEPGLLKKVVAVALDRRPFAMGKYIARAMTEQLQQLRQRWDFDAVHVDHLHMAHYQALFPDKTCALDEHNIEHKILERCVPVEPNVAKRLAFRWEARKMRRYEAALAKRFDACLTVSEEDGRELTAMVDGQCSVHVIPNGVDTRYFDAESLDGDAAPEEALVFTGSMDWLPNVDAVQFFCRDVLPRVRQARPRVRFYVVGTNPPAEITAIGRRDPRVVVTGRVDDVRPYVRNAAVFVVPIRVGGGTRLKILEAMAMQKAVVSTTLGAEGIRHTAGENIVIADEPAAFANQVIALLDRPQQARELGRKGRRLVLDAYDWDIIGRQLESLWREPISSPGQTSSLRVRAIHP